MTRTKLFEFRLTFDNGREVLFYFRAKDSDDAWTRLWDKAREQGHNPHAIKGAEITWRGDAHLDQQSLDFEEETHVDR